MKQSNIRSGHSHVDAVYLLSSEQLSPLCWAPGWVVQGAATTEPLSGDILGAQNPPSLPLSFLGSGEASLDGTITTPRQLWTASSHTPRDCPPSQTCCQPLMSDCCHVGTGLLPYKERAARVCINIARNIYVWVYQIRPFPTGKL